mmetsp:Transcript_36820/g.79818  ORF Transcript_36820/g.79818 Transcript_36820/m.79818 type:complete len:261 (-) Transcript_36820:1223-2005(-)
MLVHAERAHPISALRRAALLQPAREVGSAAVAGELNSDLPVLFLVESVGQNGSYRMQEKISPFVCHHSLSIQGACRLGLSTSLLQEVSICRPTLLLGATLRNDHPLDDVVHGMLLWVEVRHDLLQLPVEVEKLCSSDVALRQLLHRLMPLWACSSVLTLMTRQLLLAHSRLIDGWLLRLEAAHDHEQCDEVNNDPKTRMRLKDCDSADPLVRPAARRDIYGNPEDEGIVEHSSETEQRERQSDSLHDWLRPLDLRAEELL